MYWCKIVKVQTSSPLNIPDLGRYLSNEQNGAKYIQSTTQLNIPNLITTGPPALLFNNDTTCDTVASFSKFYLPDASFSIRFAHFL